MNSKDILLFFASLDNNQKEVKSLLKKTWFSKPANVNSTYNIEDINTNGDYPVHIAVRNKNLKMLEYMVSAGADLTMRNKNNETALHIAATMGLKQIAEFLIQKGACINEDKDFYKTPLYLALKNQQIEMADFLMQQDTECLSSKEACFLAMVEANLPLSVKWLIEKGCNINSRTPWDNTNILLNTLEKKNTEVARVLIEAGANILAKGKQGKGTLHYAVESELSEVAELLIVKGVDVNLTDSNNNTALTYAIKSNNLQIAELLLSNKLNWDSGNNKTLIVEAAMKGSLPAVQLLLRYGADVNAKLYNTYPELSALDAAISKKYFELASELVINGALFTYDIRSGKKFLFTDAVKTENLELIELMIIHGADCNENDHTPIAVALNAENSELISFLIQKGAIASESMKESVQQVLSTIQELKKINETEGMNLYLFLFHENKKIREIALKRFIELNPNLFEKPIIIDERLFKLFNGLVDLNISEKPETGDDKTLLDLLKFYGSRSNCYFSRNNINELVLGRTNSSGNEYEITIKRNGQDSYSEKEEMTHWN